MDIAEQKPLTLYITSDKAGFETIAIPMGYAPAGSYEVQPYTLGDVNEDGGITSGDSLSVLRIVVKLDEPTDRQKLAADVNFNGTVDSGDSLKILRYVVKLIDSWDEN